MPEFRLVMVCCEYNAVSSTFCLVVKDNHRKNLQAGNCGEECQLNRAKPGEVKGSSQIYSKTINGKNVKHCYLPPH